MPSSHSPDGLVVAFDDDHAVANAGLVLVATLAQRLGIEPLVDQLVDLGECPGAYRPGRKVLTLLHAMAAGGDCIDDADVLGTGSTAALLGHRVMAPSTLGTFLRVFTFGHIRQLDRVTEQLLARAWAAGAGPEALRCLKRRLSDAVYRCLLTDQRPGGLLGQPANSSSTIARAPGAPWPPGAGSGGTGTSGSSAIARSSTSPSTRTGTPTTKARLRASLGRASTSAGPCGPSTTTVA